MERPKISTHIDPAITQRYITDSVAKAHENMTSFVILQCARHAMLQHVLK